MEMPLKQIFETEPYGCQQVFL
uniref:Uncharacterized protein n=1 Tax=Anguilla anguilla TaxID=7936 RepID=A0A0E9VYQ4_ANGAN